MIPKHPQNDDHTLKHMPIQCNHRNLYIYLLYMYNASANTMQCNLVTKSIYWARPLIEFKKLMESESYLRIFLVEKHGAFSFLCHWQTGSICSTDSRELFLPLSFSSHLCSILYLFISHSRNVGENIILRCQMLLCSHYLYFIGGKYRMQEAGHESHVAGAVPSSQLSPLIYFPGPVRRHLSRGKHILVSLIIQTPSEDTEIA